MNIFAVAAVGVVGLLIGLARPKALAVLVLIIGLSVRTLVQTTGVEALSLADDASVLLLAGCVTLRYPLRASAIGRRALIAALIFGGLGVISGLLAGAPSAIIASGAYAALKGVVLAWSVGKIDWTENDLRRFVRAAFWFAVILIASAVLNLLFQDSWNRLFLGTDVDTITRYGRESLIGPFIHPYDMALLSSVLVVVLVAGRRYLPSSILLALIVVALSIALVLTNRRLALIGLILALPIALSTGRQIVARLSAGATVLTIGAFVLWPVIAPAYNIVYEQYFENPTQAARTVISIDSVEIANENFPLGAGFGRFGSRPAAENYSPLYIERGYSKVFGLQPPTLEGGNSKFLTDTQIAPILGETGWLGLLAFLCLLIFITPRKLEGFATPPGRAMSQAINILALVVAAGSGVYMYPPGSALIWFILGICVAIQPSEAVSPSPKPTEQLDSNTGGNRLVSRLER